MRLTLSRCDVKRTPREVSGARLCGAGGFTERWQRVPPRVPIGGRLPIEVATHSPAISKCALGPLRESLCSGVSCLLSQLTTDAFISHQTPPLPVEQSHHR